MAPVFRTRWFTITIPEFLVLLLVSLNFITCADQVMIPTLPSLDSATDTVVWVREMQSNSYESNNVNTRIIALNALGAYYSAEEKYDSARYFYSRLRIEAYKANLVHEQVTALEKISGCYLSLQQKDSALVCMQEALRISTAANSTSDIALALQELGIYYLYEQDSANALKYFYDEIKYDLLLHDSSALAACYSNMAIVYSQKGDYARSIQSYERAITIAESLDNDTSLAIYNLNLGIVFKDQGSYDFALNCLLKAGSFLERVQYLRELGSCYNSIGNIYNDIHEPEKAIEYHTLALHLRDSIGNKKGSAGSLTNLGLSYILLGQYDTAISYLNRSLIVKNELGDQSLIASSLDLLGEAYYHKKEFVKAESQYKLALELKSDVGDPKSMSVTLNKLGLLYHEWNRDNEALKHLQVARVELERIGAKRELMESYRTISDVFVTQGNSDSALYYIDQFVAVKDSVMNEDKQKAVTEMEVKYDSEKKEQEIILLNQGNQVKEAMVSRQNTMIYSLIAGTVLLIVVIVLLYIAVRSRRLALKQTKVIIEQKQTIIEQKQTLMGELHHRIKNNLQVLSSLLALQQSRIKDPAMTELMQAIDQRLTAMLLIHQGLYGDHVGSQVNMRNYIEALIENLCRSYGYAASELNVSTNIAPLRLDADKALSLGFVCNEIISNWFKHVLKGNDNATLNVEFNGSVLRFSDNGPGIPTGDSAEHHGSFGLRLIKLFSRELNATLLIHSDKSGTIIALEIPEQK